MTAEGQVLQKDAVPPVRWTAGQQAPYPDPAEIPVSAYTDPDLYAREIKVMKRSWLLVCHSSEIREKGDTFLAEQLGSNIAIVRQGDGALAAWHAICQHRSTALLRKSQAGVRRFVCPYHHWTYGLDGRLIGVTQKECFKPEALEGIRLPPVHVDEVEGWVWINIAQESPTPLREWLGELVDEWAPYHMDRSVLITSHFDVVLPGNWKRALEAFIEIYHVNYLHRESTPPDVMKCDQASFHMFALHSMMVSPLTAMLDDLERSKDHQAHTLVNYLAFPLSVINNLPMQYQAYTFAPLGIDKTRMRIWLLYPEGQDTPERVATAKGEVAYVASVFDEDVFICGEQTRTDGSDGGSASILGRRECRIAHLHKVMTNELKSLEK